MNEAKIKTDVKGFNDLPSRREILNGLHENGILLHWKPIDLLPPSNFQNGYDTIILGIPEKETTFFIGIKIGQFARDFFADAFDYRYETIDGEQYVIPKTAVKSGVLSVGC